MSPDAAAVDAWVRADIAKSGGTGRRLSRVQMGLGWWDEDEPRLRAAIKELRDEHGWTLDEPVPGLGFVYLVPPL